MGFPERQKFLCIMPMDTAGRWLSAPRPCVTGSERSSVRSNPLEAIRKTLLREKQLGHKHNVRRPDRLQVSSPNRSECDENGSTNCKSMPRPNLRHVFLLFF